MTARPVVETDGLLQNPASAADIPSLDLLLACPDGQALAADYGRSRLAGMLRQLLDEARPQALAGTLAASALAHSVLLGQAKSRLKAQDQSRMRARSEEHTSELQSLMRSSYAVFCLKKKTQEP